MRILAIVLTSLAGLAPLVHAQAPATGTTVQSAPAAPPPLAPANSPLPPTNSDTAALLQTLQQLKAANAAILARQQATLAQLAEMEKASQQLKVFTVGR